MKKWWQSKTIWIGLGQAIGSLGAAAAGEVSWGAAIPAAILGLLQIIQRDRTLKKGG